MTFFKCSLTKLVKLVACQSVIKLPINIATKSNRNWMIHIGETHFWIENIVNLCKSLPFLVHYAIWLKWHRFVLLNVLYTRRSLCPFQWYVNWLWLLLDCFAHATLPKFVYRNWPNRIWFFYRTMHIRRVHYFHWYTNTVNRVLGRKCPHNFE